MDDLITEALENDNLQLQNMSGQKYVQTNSMFLDAVARWQRNLGTVDSVLSCWLDVQKKWQALESIFVGSADIRVQLPEDSRRFDVVNSDFQVGTAATACCKSAACCMLFLGDGLVCAVFIVRSTVTLMVYGQ